MTPLETIQVSHPKPNRDVQPASRWITLRKVVQGIALAAFLLLFIAARRGGWPASLVNAPIRLDPLTVLAHLFASRTLLAGSTLALLVVLISVLVGRAWCGWLCPLGTVLDIFPVKAGLKHRKSPPESWRSIKYGLLVVILVAALFGNLTLLIFDPLTILVRTLSTSIWPMLDRVVTAVEAVLYNVSFLNGPVTSIDQVIRPALLPPVPMYYRDTLLFAAVFLGVILLNAIAPRFWCRYLCPLGGLLGLIAKISIFRRTVTPENCKNCALCARACPTGTINPDKDFTSDPGECTLCLECLRSCPKSAIRFSTVLKPAAWENYNPSRRAALGGLAAAVVGTALFRSDRFAKRDDAHLIRPPGALENDLINKCVRCGECVRSCPTSALQPAALEAGLESLWTPVLLMRMGYCDYACNACGQACPVQAIPPLVLEEKRQAVIGLAYIDQNRCIPWADHIDCIVCEEMCPIPEKAVLLKEAPIELVDGSVVTVKLPYVLRDRCIGCGICEYKCPLNGEAAIRVWTPNLSLPS